MGTQQNFEWRFCDEDSDEDQWWASMQPVTHHNEKASGWQRGRLRTLLVIFPFLALLLWSRPWQSNEAIRQPERMATTQPMSHLPETPTASSADVQAPLTIDSIETGDYIVAKGYACFCSCIVLEPSGCISYHAYLDAIPRQPISSTATKP